MKGYYEEKLSSVVASEWSKVGRKHWQHVGGVQVKYDCNHWTWQVIGGPRCGNHYQTKWVAQMEGTKDRA